MDRQEKRALNKSKDAGLSRDERKEKRKKARKRIVWIQKCVISILFVGIIGIGTAVVWNYPEIKMNRFIEEGKAYTQAASCSEAIESYKQALEIDETNVRVYRYMADAYLDIGSEAQAKKILFEGWEKTQDDELLQYYGTIILNEAVKEINEDKTDWETADKIISVMELNVMKQDAVELIKIVYERLISGMQINENFDFKAYEQLIERLMKLYQKEQNAEIGKVISQYAMLDVTELVLAIEQVETYLKILEAGNGIHETPERSELIACLKKETEIQEMFAGMFEEFAAGNYEAAKEFIVSSEYLDLRDAFINGTMEYWAGATYIPLNREKVIVKKTETGWNFEFQKFEENETTAGVITVWGVDMEDNGVLRTGISYEPPMEGKSYYPHTEYVISYVNSNVQTNNAFEYAMNYHFETKIRTEEGMTTEIIGDWGGPYQWKKTY